MTNCNRRDFLKLTAGLGAVTVVGFDPLFGTIKEAFAEGAPQADQWFMSICPYCGTGCGVDVGVAQGKVVAVKGMADHPINKGELCVLGKNLVGMLHSDDRLLFPMKRDGEQFKQIAWNEAIETVATKFKETIEKHGADSVAMYISASEYIEEYYIYNKFVKGCLGTNNLESSARLCWASGVVGLVKAFGADSPPCAFEDIELADLFFVAGYNPSSSKPIFFKRLMKAKKANKTTMIVVDPRKTDTAKKADVHLQIKPGTDVVLHNALVNVLISNGLINETEAKRITRDFDKLKTHVEKYTPKYASEITGLSEKQIIETAKMIGKSKGALFMWGQGLNQSRIGTRKVTSLLNIPFITGHIGKPGAGPMAVTGQSTAMSLRETGALPHILPGFRKVDDEKARNEIAQIWGVESSKISPKAGKTIADILKSIENGEIKALWVIHSNPVATFPDTQWVRETFKKLDFLVVQDCYHPTETSQYAHILLAGSQWSEKGGTMTNSERGLNLIEQAVQPLGESKADLDIVMEVARKMGFEKQFAFKNNEEIFEEFKLTTKGRVNDISGLNYARLKKEKGIQWPVPTPDHVGTKRRFIDRSFPGTDGKLNLTVNEHLEPAEIPNAEYPLWLITGLVNEQFHSRTRTAKIPALNKAIPAPFVEIHPEDAKQLKIKDGDMLKVSSKRGSVKARATLTEFILKGTIFIPYHFGHLAGEEQAVNNLTNRSFDEAAKQPEYKAAAVKIEKV